MEKKLLIIKFSEWICIIAIIIAFITFVVFAYHLVFNSESKQTDVDVRAIKIIELRPGASQNQKDSVLRLVIAQNQTIQDSLIKMNRKFVDAQVKSKDNDDRMKTYASIVGLILALTGLFGFKSFNDVRESGIIAAKNDAKEAAKTEAKKVAEEEAKKVAELTAKEAAEKVAKTTSEQVAQQIAERVAGPAAELYLKNSIADYKSDIRDIKTIVKEQIKTIDLKFKNFKREQQISTVGSTEELEQPAESPVETQVSTFFEGGEAK